MGFAVIQPVEIVEIIEKTMEVNFDDKLAAASSTLSQLGLDSLDVLELVHLMQDKFDMVIKNDRYNSFMSFTPVMISDVINKKTEANPA